MGQKNSDYYIMENLQINNLNRNLNTDWIESLAFDEINMDEAGVVDFNEHLDPQSFLEEDSIRFMNEIRDLFEVYITRFNECRGGPNSGAQIKIFKISNTVNDFMIFRNSLRLIFSRKSSDLIVISLLANGKDIFAPRLNEANQSGFSHHEICAAIGPFNCIKWKFQGEEVNSRAMVKHYLMEFIKNSAR